MELLINMLIIVLFSIAAVHFLKAPAKRSKFIKFMVWDATINNAPSRNFEIWVRGTGSWYPKLHLGADFKEFGPFPVGETQQLFIYPTGREGSEIELSFTPNREMFSGSDRDAIMQFKR